MSLLRPFGVQRYNILSERQSPTPQNSPQGGEKTPVLSLFNNFIRRANRPQRDSPPTPAGGILSSRQPFMPTLAVAMGNATAGVVQHVLVDFQTRAGRVGPHVLIVHPGFPYNCAFISFTFHLHSLFLKPTPFLGSPAKPCVYPKIIDSLYRKKSMSTTPLS